MLQLDTGDLKTLTITNLFCRQYQKVPFVDGSQLLTSRYGNFFTYEFRPFDWCLLYDHLTSFFQGTFPSHSGLVLQTNRSLVNQTYLYNICLREGNLDTNEGDVLDCFFWMFSIWYQPLFRDPPLDFRVLRTKESWYYQR